MFSSFFTFLLLLLLLLLFTLLCHCHSPIPRSLPNECNEKCGKFHIPFPFHLNISCATISPAFHLSCTNSTTLYLNIDSQSYKVLEFFSDGILVDFPGASTCRQYNDLNSFRFSGNDHFGISSNNVIGLYDCEDSSLCKADCETINLSDCDGNSNASPACCYPLSDHSSWNLGDGFSVFSKFGCRGFSSWAVTGGSNTGKRGVKLEWAVPARNYSMGACAINANTVNATSVEGGVRCKCQDGFVGDGFATGVGCLKSCIKNGVEANGTDCYTKRQSGKEVSILAGVVGPIFIIVSLIALFCLLKRPGKSGSYDPDQAHFHSTISFRKACRTRLFTYHELEEATKGFEDAQIIMHSWNGTIYAGVLADGSHVAVHKVNCQDERDVMQVLSRVEVLSAVLHRNMARILGCCIDCGYTPLVVYEYPANGTLEEHLLASKAQGKTGLDWYKRMNIAAEIACVLTFLQYEIIPSIFHHSIKSGCIFLDENLSAKIAGFRLFESNLLNESSPNNRSDVYEFGVMLLELVTGSNTSNKDLPALVLQKIRNGKLEEIVDPSLYYHEQPSFRREQIEIVADLATRCLLFGGDGKIGMIEVARELVHITKDSVDGGSKRVPALEETFSNSSLLQMISRSPDSIYLP
ncbi:probably inactive receptor-like protein kinase At2g46850 [Jatropha curcas]|uniref:probably inactive receptor-like protein kinase At2g46850 n=1 Tax=Jatropha curcas TaxID=180498 RepID=UPI0005FBAD98|nr:probably inactive receptor-like protein kinase At2g46850 [Jatropha curcas]